MILKKLKDYRLLNNKLKLRNVVDKSILFVNFHKKLNDIYILN